MRTLAPIWMLFLAGCAGSSPVGPSGTASGGRARPARPTDCRKVLPAELNPRLAAATPGQALCLEAGRYPGPLVIPSGVTLWGPADAVIQSAGKGTTLRLEGNGARLLGVTVDGSGGRFDTLDAAVHVTGEDAVVEGVRVVNATFGILVEKARRARILGNEVIGDAQAALGLRGDGIRLWETHDSVVEDNRVQDSRDLVVWYSRNNTLRRNRVTGGRYGTHFMYSHDCVAEDNLYRGNEVGVFVMYSRGIRLSRNVLAQGIGAAGMGLGMKESGDLTAVENLFLHNTVGLYVDSSPIQQNEHNRFERNVFRLHDAAVIFHGTERNNSFLANTFRDNQTQVRVEGRTDGLSTEWQGNSFDDYRGFDLDRDGVGDVAYELKSLSDDLVGRHASLAFFRGSPALGLVSVAGEIIPMFAPKVLMTDPAPHLGETVQLGALQELLRED